MVQPQVEEDGGPTQHDPHLHHVYIDDSSETPSSRADQGEGEDGQDADVEVPLQGLLDEQGTRIEVNLGTSLGNTILRQNIVNSLIF